MCDQNWGCFWNTWGPVHYSWAVPFHETLHIKICLLLVFFLFRVLTVNIRSLRFYMNGGIGCQHVGLGSGCRPEFKPFPHSFSLNKKLHSTPLCLDSSPTSRAVIKVFKSLRGGSLWVFYPANSPIFGIVWPIFKLTVAGWCYCSSQLKNPGASY